MSLSAEYTASKPWTPHGYQKLAIKFLLEHQAAALFADPGTGKTSTTLGAFKILHSKGMAKRMLILAPLRVCYSVWPAEVQKWSDFSHLKVCVLHGANKNSLLDSDADIFLLNYEGLEWFTVAEGFKRIHADVLVMDEISKMKNSQSQRFRILKPRLQLFQRRWGLTGSPAPNGLLDLFGQVYCLDMGYSLGRYITHYRMEYFNNGGFGNYQWTPKEGAEARIYERLAPLVLRLDAKDYLELPELVNNNIWVDLPPKARSIYKELETLFLTEIQGEEITAMTAASASMKCRQVANGAVYRQDATGIRKFDGDGAWFPIHDEKIQALKDLVEELQGQPLLVAYEFQHDLERLLKAFPGTPYIGGGVSGARSNEICTLWNQGKLPILFAHPQSTAFGLNLQGSGFHVCWFSITWNLELYEQFIRRVYRQGQKSSHVFVHHILAKDTLDIVVMKTLQAKDRVQGNLLKALRNYSRERVA